MPVLRILPQGAKLHTDPMPGDHERAKRQKVTGWTNRSTRSNRDFLFSVEPDGLTGTGFAVTLTLRECPESADAWQASRRAWVRRMERAGLIRLHWLTEWQKRGHPHLHGAAWFEGEIPPGEITGPWIQAAARYEPASCGQDARPLTSVTGWFEYLAKHATRGLYHYQRSPENIPPGWDKTGRMWGHVGAWPRAEGLEIAINHAGLYRLRRLWNAHEIAKARARRDWARVRYLRRRLQRCKVMSEYLGMAEFGNRDVNLQMLHAIAMRDDVEVST